MKRHWLSLLIMILIKTGARWSWSSPFFLRRDCWCHRNQFLTTWIQQVNWSKQGGPKDCMLHFHLSSHFILWKRTIHQGIPKLLLNRPGSFMQSIKNGWSKYFGKLLFFKIYNLFKGGGKLGLTCWPWQLASGTRAGQRRPSSLTCPGWRGKRPKGITDLFRMDR